MKNDWILDVLTDLRAFAAKNGLPDLAARLGDTAQAAALELASTEMRVGRTHGDEFVSGNYSRTDRAGRRA